MQPRKLGAGGLMVGMVSSAEEMHEMSQPHSRGS